MVVNGLDIHCFLISIEFLIPSLSTSRFRIMPSAYDFEASIANSKTKSVYSALFSVTVLDGTITSMPGVSEESKIFALPSFKPALFTLI